MNRSPQLNHLRCFVLLICLLISFAGGTMVEADDQVNAICACLNHGDCDGSGTVDLLDVTLMINHLFRGAVPPPSDPGCPHLHRGDWDCNDRVNLVDLALMIRHVFRYPAPGPCDPCGTPEYRGSESCADCHHEIWNSFAKTGHGYILNQAADALTPSHYPFGDLEGPPPGYSREEIRYVIGGFWERALFIDLEGYLLTGANPSATTQWNLPTPDSPDPEWVAYHAGEVRPYDCGPCHQTGYRREGHQDGLPGIVGSWKLNGVQCEECHGPAQFHVSSPLDFPLEIDRSRESCLKCHTMDDSSTDPHDVLHCIDCHDPHQSLHEDNPGRALAIHTPCQGCHFSSSGDYPGSALLPHFRKR